MQKLNGLTSIDDGGGQFFDFTDNINPIISEIREKYRTWRERRKTGREREREKGGGDKFKQQLSTGSDTNLLDSH